MKSSMKKLPVFVMIAAIAIFAAAATALAWGPILQGEYEVVGSGQCAPCPGGTISEVNGVCTSNATGATVAMTPGPVSFYDGVYKFSPTGRGKGTGSATLTSKGFSSGAGSVGTLAFQFQYTVDEAGAITFTTIPGTDTSTTLNCNASGGDCAPVGTPTPLSTGPQHGNISPDGDILLIHCGAPVTIVLAPAAGPTGVAELICNISLNGFKKWPY